MSGFVFGLDEALRLTLGAIGPLPAERVSLINSVGRVAAADLCALVNSPSVDASLKDGYAVLARDLVGATPADPVRLRLGGSIPAGGGGEAVLVASGTAAKVLTGARIPTGADAVLPEEAVKLEGTVLVIDAPVGPGTNILPRGRDVSLGTIVLNSGQEISPGLTGLLAAAGHSEVPVFKVPVVAIVGTGDEIVAPGKPLPEGMLYASNIATLGAWCDKYRMRSRPAIARDDHQALRTVIGELSDQTDCLITSGGAWTGDRDIVTTVLKGLGWKEVFHRVRIGPGKAVGFGLLHGKPVFVLPGGPPSNLMAFLQIALPGLLAMSGRPDGGLPRVNAKLAAGLKGREQDWTDFFFGGLALNGGLPVFRPLEYRSRLSSIAGATAVAAVPEGQVSLPKGAIVSVQLLE